MSKKKKRVNVKRGTRPDPSVKNRRVAIETLAASLGVPKLFTRLPKDAAVQLAVTGIHPPKIVAASSFSADKDHCQIIHEIESAISTRTIYLDGIGEKCTLPKFFSTVCTLGALVSHYRRHRHHATELDSLAVPLERAYNDETVNRALNYTFWEVVNVLVQYMRFDVRILVPTLTHYAPHRQPSRLLITINKELPREHHLVVDDIDRKVYQCGSVYDSEEVDWISWSGGYDGGLVISGNKPVYVPNHTIKRLFERIGITGYSNWAIDALYHCLRTPTVVKSHKEWLVEYTFLGVRLGYLVASELNDCVLIRTFLFLTMRGTPEEKQIRERIKGHRNSVEILKMDNLGAFTASDVRFDDDLRRLFSDCGCEHLFEFGDRIYKNDCKVDHACNVRRILGWKIPTDIQQRLVRK